MFRMEWIANKKEFTPRVPLSACTDFQENATIPRICFSDSIERCFQAKEGILKTGAMFTLYTLQIAENDPDLLTPAVLFKNDYVPDALESHEYWLVRPITLHGIYRIVNGISRSFEFAWTAIKSEDVLSVLDETAISHEFVNADMSAEQIYNIAQGNLSASKAYDLQDFLYDRIAELPWAQLLKINKVDAFEWNGAKFGVACIHDNAE